MAGNARRIFGAGGLVATLLSVWSFATAQERTADEHWAYRPIVRPRIPAVRQVDWPATAVDRFVLARLEAAGLSPAPEAARPLLARRLALALTGLPPTVEDVDEFATDEGPDAVERWVDRWLASPAYGERMATPWLDLARYADTHGYHADTHREMWRWRDWVIDAFNRGLPFDQFSIEQLAGDLLPAATLDQRIATGFQRNHMIIFENGVIGEEYRLEYVADRTNTFATVWLAQTFQCARCHDHKHDPFTRRDYYRLFAYFNNVPEEGLDGQFGNAAPFISAPTRLQQASLDQMAGELARLDRQIVDRLGETDAAQSRWEDAGRRQLPTLVRPPEDMVLHLKLDESEGRTARNSAALSTMKGREATIRELSIHGEPAWLETKEGRALLFDGSTWIDAGELGPLDRDSPVSLALLVFPTTTGSLPLAGRTSDDAERRGWELSLVDGRVQFRLTRSSGDDELLVRSERALAVRRWQRVLLVYDGTSRAAGVSLYVDGKREGMQVERDRLSQSIRTTGPTRLGRNVAGEGFRGMLRDVRAWTRALTGPEIAVLGGRDPVAELLAVPARQRTPEQSRQLRRWYLESQDATFRATLARRDDVERSLDSLRKSLPTTMVMQELAKPRATYVLERGDYRLPREQVFAGAPAIWRQASRESSGETSADSPAGRAANRLDLARWLFAPDQPLAARVAANRLWQIDFGVGLARTSDDFGVHGEPPVQPELLDWLADHLRRDLAWDMKRFHRLLVTSATFRQANALSARSGEADPENRLWSRGPRPRLTAEMLRDSALAASGLLVRRIGGPSVLPPQPPGLWEEVAYDVLSFTAQKFQPSTGGDVYRRGVYTFWKRAVPHPALATFDVPDRETCVVTRATSSSPLQALVLMNEPGYVAAAVELARAAAARHVRVDERIAWMFRAILARAPTREELALLNERFAAESREFAARPEAARALLSGGAAGAVSRNEDAPSLASLALIASLVQQLDEARVP